MSIRQRRSGALRRPALVVKHLGLVAFVGGLAALGALVSFGPRPQTLDGWSVLRQACRAIFWPCVFGGLIATVLSGLALFAFAPRRYARAGWFRAKVAALVILVPTLHLWGRSRMIALDESLADGRLDEASAHWTAAGTAFWVAAIVMFIVAVLTARAARRGSNSR